ncbi:Flavonol synthase/flavanone 3-hydroxylase [Capsicum chinense]|nr:Flavonol synthase/flavanone 3-hydroxylase [Capsicum chinense]
MPMEVARVQSVASITNCMDTIPSEYIRSKNEQPAATTLHGVVLQVPVIDISDIDANEEKIVKAITEASKEWGIFQVINHGIPDEVIGNLQKVGKEFFEQVPQEEKEWIAKNPGSQSIEGYEYIRSKSKRSAATTLDGVVLQKVGKEFFEEVPQEEKELIAKNPGSQSIEGYGTSLQKEVEG